MHRMKNCSRLLRLEMVSSRPTRTSRRASLPLLFFFIICISLQQTVQNIVILKRTKHVLQSSSKTITPQSPAAKLRITPSHPRPSNSISLLMGKTLSIKDVNETIKDISSLTRVVKKQQNGQGNIEEVNITWRLFCYKKETNDALIAALDGHPYQDRVEVVLAEDRVKTYFWYNHMDPSQISEDFDYVWLCDGDIILRHMEWLGFWDIVKRYDPSIFQPAITFPFEAAEKRKYLALNVHYGHCERRILDENKIPDTSIALLAGYETFIIENQLPVFRRDAWEVVKTEHDKRVGNWGEHKSDWGLDWAWCGLVEDTLTKSFSRGNYEQSKGKGWIDTKLFCNVDRGGNSTSMLQESDAVIRERPITCMVIQATPVKHSDTKSYPFHKDSGSAVFSGWKPEHKIYAEKEAQKFGEAYQDTEYVAAWFDGKGESSHLAGYENFYFRSFFMKQPIQQCRRYDCMLD